MKPLLTILAAMLTLTLFSQAPQAFNYQGVARDLSGTPLTNQEIGLQIAILQGTAGTELYKETHHVTTNGLGLFSLQIGNGTLVNGNFAAINWGDGDKYLQAELDEAGGTNYHFLGTSQLLSVPFALNAGNGSLWTEEDERINYPNKVDIGMPYNNETGIFNYNLNLRESSNDNVGISVQNTNPAGRSIILLGEQNMGRYIYLAYHNSEIENGAVEETGILSTGGSNGLDIKSRAGDIRFYSGESNSIDPRFLIRNNGNIGINNLAPTSKLQVTDGDVYIDDINRGVIMKSDNGQCWRYSPDNSGQLVPEAITCPQ